MADRPINFVMRQEPPPSFCEHWMPDDGLHEMTIRCWCEPIPDSLTSGPGSPKTTVRHKPHQRVFD